MSEFVIPDDKASQLTGFRQLTGQDCSHLCEVELGSNTYWLSRPTATAFTALVEASRERGFELAIASAHRNFQRQLLIWNEKASGLRPVLDEAGNELDLEMLDERQRVFAMLRWSALPGTSRHHWGSDIDVYDAAALTADYRVQLCSGECSSGGVFSELHRWLDESISEGRSCGFYRPFDMDCGGVAPEPWHLSFAPEAGKFERRLNDRQLYDWLAQQPIALKQTVLANFEEIFRRFIAPSRLAAGAVGE
jgi:LAS superfamily LD-carboxypeptidase LdcB